MMDKLRYYFCFPILSNIIALIFISISTVIVLNVLEVEDVVLKIVAGFLFMVTPCVSFTLMFFYCSDSYGASMLLASVFVYIVKKDFSYKNAFLSILCIIGSLALYQAYIGYAATLCISLIILYLIQNKNIIHILKKSFYFVTCALSGGVIYYALTKIIHTITGIQFSDYGGADKLGETSVLDIKIAVAISYKKFYELFLDYMGIESTQFLRLRGIFIIILLCFFFATVVIIAQNRLYKEPIRIVLIIGAFLIYPFINGIILLIVKNHGIHSLMIQSYYIIFVLFATVMDMYQRNVKKTTSLISPLIVSVIFAIFVLGFSFEIISINNATYEFFNIKRNKMVSTANRILTEAENLDGYDMSSEFIFAGRLDSEYPIETYLEKMSFSDLGVLVGSSLFQNNAIIENIYREDIGCFIHICDDKKYKEIVNTDEFDKMPIYPAHGSVKMIDDVVVAKLSDEIFMPE